MGTFEGNRNPDGTNADGNKNDDNNDNWGGCGFQRHFPWNTGADTDGRLVTNPEASMHCKLGVFTCAANANAQNNYKTLMTQDQFGFNLETSGFGDTGNNHVFGKVTLGAICKLWIPVHRQHIDSVHVAGVHVKGGGELLTGDIPSGGNPDNIDTFRQTVFNGARVSNKIVDGSANTFALAKASSASGTAYCFSVVNIGEFTRNNMPGSNFNVMNGNVAGEDSGGMDMKLLQGRQDGNPNNPDYGDGNTNSQYPINFGDSLNFSNGKGTIVEGGANFDVVVHFKSAWCIRHWTMVDMQAWDDPTTVSNRNHGDWGALVEDYVLTDADPAHHHHTDAFDKRFNANVGICGCGHATTGVRYADLPAIDQNSVQATGCKKQTTDTNCADTLNNYAAAVDSLAETYYWPNAGAWAAFYSFITCSNDDFMVYETASGDGTTVPATVPETTTNAEATKLAERMVVHSMFYNDIRHDYTASNGADHLTGNVNIRGNIRQVGRHVKYCAPGWMNWSAQDDSNSPPNGGMSANAVREVSPNEVFKRCTWNWNFNGNALTGSDAATNGITSRDPETWFNGAEAGHGSTNSNGKGPFGEFRPWGNRASATTNAGIGTNNAEIFRHEDSINGFGHLIFPVVHEIKFHLNFRFETATDGTTAGTPPAASATNPHAPKHNAANTYKLSIDAAKYAADVGEVLVGGVPNTGITNLQGGHHFAFTLKCLVSSLDGTGDEITDQTVTQTKTHITAGNSNVHVKDMWPDCYLGDEIHFNYKISMGAVGNEIVEHRINAWDSVITTENSVFWPAPAQ